MSTGLAMETLRLWKSGRCGTPIGHAAVQQILDGVYKESIEDVMKGTPILGIKSAIQALQQLWHLLEAEIDNFKRNGCVFRGTHLSKQDCYIIANMVPTIVSHELGQAAFLGDGTGPTASSATSNRALMKRKRSFDDSDDEDEDYRQKRRRSSPWPGENTRQSVFQSGRPSLMPLPENEIQSIQAGKLSIPGSDDNKDDYSRRKRRLSPSSSPDLLQEDCKQEDGSSPTLSQIPHISEK